MEPLLVVEISGESYAVPTGEIIEILVPGVIRSMPAAPDWVAGLIDRRGSPLLVLSAAALLGRPATGGPSTVPVIDVPGIGDVEGRQGQSWVTPAWTCIMTACNFACS